MHLASYVSVTFWQRFLSPYWHFISQAGLPFLDVALIPLHAKEVKSRLFLLGLSFLMGAICQGQTPMATPAPAPMNEENYVPPWVKEENKEVAGLDWYVAPALGVSLVSDTDINQFSGTSGGTNISSGAATLAYNPGFRMDCPIGTRITDWFALEFAPGFMVNTINYLEPTQGSLNVGSQTVSQNGQASLVGDYYQIPILANFLFTIPILPQFNISAGFGIGGMVSAAQTTSLQGVSLEDSDGIGTALSFAYAGQFGLNFPFSDDMQAGLYYKYTGTGAQDFTGGGFFQYVENNHGTSTQSVEGYFLYRF
jgi:opacity protein-like surface antigen